ncbi:hypothetical protein [Geobacter sp. AOG2]|uniref:hypothetical protein n=1 Tax=Geobacter sp. AOG2 TaxID=1566347 RepID=UPI001CC793DC|nr:hypothetical protein [Geobacter sp. AOG2]GFE61172.1 hypothetical protein AOG2_17590 [Geobacter sp. AOG2]
MPGKDDIEEKGTETPVQRLCNEIQLFDLCDLERCNYKNGRFCTNGELLVRFDRISEKDDTHTYLPEGPEEGEDTDEDAFGDALDDRDDDDRDDWDDD